MRSFKIALAVGAMLVASAGAVSAQYGGYGYGSNSSNHYTQGYTRQDGTYVGGYHSTNPNSTQYDNYGTRNNYNPYSGAYGTRSPRY